MLGWSLEPALMVAVSGLLLCSLHLGRVDEAAGCGGASRVVPTMLMVIQRVDGTATNLLPQASRVALRTVYMLLGNTSSAQRLLHRLSRPLTSTAARLQVRIVIAPTASPFVSPVCT